jgi:hypothetical protein
VETGGLNRYLPHVAVATFAVLGLPAIAATAVQAAAGMPAVAGVVLAIALSMVASSAGSAIWMRRPASRDLLFGDLMVWGWLRRVRSERRLAEATRLLGGELSAGRRAEVLEQLAAGLEARDVYTHGHSRRVTAHAEEIARRMGLSRELVAKVRTAAAVHDVGKVFTPREVLLKPGRLSDVEFEVIKRHPVDGADMVAELEDRDITAMVLHHHQRLDGSGYPDGLRGDDIPLGARIIAVADTFDAMTSTRPYRPARSHRCAMDVLAKEAGSKLDAEAVAAFRSYYSRPLPVAGWSLLVTVPQRLVAWAGGALQGGAASLGAAALIGGSMMGPAPGEARPEPSADRTAAVAASAARADRRSAARARAAAAGGGDATPRRLVVAPRRRGKPAARFQSRSRAQQPAAPQADRPQQAPVRPPGGSQPQPPPKPPAVPPVQLPDVPKPPVQLPPVHVPPVELPGVRVPEVRVPEVRLPEVRVPLGDATQRTLDGVLP